MRKWLLRAGIFMFTVVVAAGLSYHFALRDWCLGWGTTPSEVHSVLPGDALFPVFAAEATHAITIEAPPQRVWAWIMQMGQDRGGFYSYSILEDVAGCDMPKVERLVADWKPRTVGETVWFVTPKRYGGQGRMIAAVVQPQRSFVMVSVKDWALLQVGRPAQEGFWSFTLVPLGAGQTRLIARVRGETPKTVTSRAVGRLFWEPMHFIMEQKMLRTIRELSERG